MQTITNDTWLLTVGTFLPLVGVLLMMFVPASEEKTHKQIGILTSAVTAAVGVYTLLRFDFDQSEKLQFFVDSEWITVIKSNYTIGLDGISLPLYFLSMVVTLLVMIYTWDNMPDAGNPKSFIMLMLVLQVGMAGSFIAQDLILFFVFFEVVLLPMYFMIGVWGGDDRQYASLKFFLYTMFGSALMLVAFLALFFQTGAASFSFAHLMEAGALIDRDVQIWIFAGMFVGFAVKVPMFPFHTWLPDAHTQARAWVCASGSHVWNGNIGTFTAKPTNIPAKIQICTSRSISAPASMRCANENDAAPVWKKSARKATSIRAEPNMV